MPAPIALNADIVLQKGDKIRSMPLDAFYLGYQKTALEAGEFVAAIRVPRPRADLRFRTYKIPAVNDAPATFNVALYRKKRQRRADDFPLEGGRRAAVAAVVFGAAGDSRGDRIRRARCGECARAARARDVRSDSGRAGSTGNARCPKRRSHPGN